jgi:flagellar biosynthesis/type III secretory pathway chaperone
MTLHTKETQMAHDAEHADAVKTVRAVVNLMSDLANVMQEEANVLEQRKFTSHAELLKRKQRLTLDYRATMKNFAAQPDLLKKMPDDLRTSVREAAQKLSDVTERNARTLRTAVIGVQRLLQSIIGIVKKETLSGRSYTNPNTERFRLGTYSPLCKAVAITRTA